MLRRPLLLYDGDCTFCRNCARKWERVTAPHVEYASSQARGAEFPGIDPARFERTVVFIEVDGGIRLGADAVLAALGSTGMGRFGRVVYRRVPGAASLAEWGYRWVADHRRGAATWLGWLCPGETPQESE